MIDWSKYPNFHETEFASKDLPGSGENMKESFLSMLQEARVIANVEFKINSGFRTNSHNKSVGGRPNSAHLRGHAADISTPSLNIRFIIINSLIKVGFKRIGVYDSFVHCDNDRSLSQDLIWLQNK